MNQQLLSILTSIHQEYLVQSLSEDQQNVLLSDLLHFSSIYPGGIQAYVERAAHFLTPKPKASIQYYSIDVLYLYLLYCRYH